MTVENKLSIKRIEMLDEVFAAFPFSMLQDFITFQVHCKRAGIDAGEIVQYVRHHVGDIAILNQRKELEASRIFAQKAPKCLICNMTMSLEPINNYESRMIDEHSKSWWVCPDINCAGEPIISDMYPFEVLIDLGIPVHKPITPQAKSRKRIRSAAKKRGCGKKRRQQL